MANASLGLLIVSIVLAIGFGIVNSFNDAANAIATKQPDVSRRYVGWWVEILLQPGY